MKKMCDKKFKCDWCEEMCDTLDRFDVTIDNGDGTIDSGLVCAECIGQLILNDPRSIAVMTIDRTCEMEDYVSPREVEAI